MQSFQTSGKIRLTDKRRHAHLTCPCHPKPAPAQLRGDVLESCQWPGIVIHQIEYRRKASRFELRGNVLDLVHHELRVPPLPAAKLRRKLRRGTERTCAGAST